jgi:DUF4097 and DUF4098 domain-containing protein YvlB
MKTKQLLCTLAVLGLMVPLAASAEIRDDITRSFDAKAGGKLVLEADFGDIDIRTHASSKVDVLVKREARTSSDSKARDLFEDYRVTFNQSGDVIEIRAEKPGSGWNWSNRLDVRFEISVPSQFNLDLRTAGGDVRIADLTGDVEASTSGGDLDLGRVDGVVRVRTSGGDVGLKDVTGDVVARTSGGDVKVGRVGGRVEAKTSGGDIEVRGAGADLEVSTSGGDIDLFDIEGPVRASTSGGDITARLTRSPAESCKLSTSGGSIDLYLAPGVGLQIEASSTGGRVSADVPVTITEMDGKSRISGSINGGGATMTMRTSSGSIRIRSMN